MFKSEIYCLLFDFLSQRMFSDSQGWFCSPWRTTSEISTKRTKKKWEHSSLSLWVYPVCILVSRFFSNSFQLSTHKKHQKHTQKKESHRFSDFLHLPWKFPFLFPPGKPPPPGRGRTNVVCGSTKTPRFGMPASWSTRSSTQSWLVHLFRWWKQTKSRSFLGALNRDISGEIYKGNQLR